MNKQSLKEQLLLREIPIDDQKINSLMVLMDTTLKTNEKFNLTAIKDEESFIEKMIFDSAIALEELDLSNKIVIDVGTGAGFPGMVLYILNPSIHLTLLDSTKKKIDYLANYCSDHQYQVECVTSRAEEFNRREYYDYAFARAVAPLNILLELIIPLLKVGGTFIALKGQGYEKELEESESALKKLHCHLVKIIDDELPESLEKRVMIYIQKEKETNKKYPRSYSDIKKLPL